MILRKMKNNALKNYPKEYDSAAQRDAVENMWDDNDDSIKEKSSVAKDVVAKVEHEINEETKEGAIQDFTVDEDGVVNTENKVPAETEAPAAETTVKEEKEPANEDYGF